MDEETGKPKSKVVYRLDPRFRQRDDVFTVMKDGDEYNIRIKDALVAEQLKRMNQSQINAIVAGFAKVNRWLAMVNTALNPEFVITNFERDLATAMVHLAGEQTGDIARQVLMDVPKAAKGILQETFQHSGSNEWRELYKEMRKVGGTIGFFGMEDIETRMKRIQGRLDRGKGFTGKTREGIENIRDFILDANIAVENAARLASYKAVRDALIENGMEPKKARERAASVAKNLTVNFNRKGELAPLMNSLYLFYNASIQGAARIFTALRYKRVRQILYGTVALGFLQAMFNEMMGGDDEDDVPQWNKVSDFTKQTNMIFMKPWEPGEYYKVRLPYGYNVPYYTGVLLHDVFKDPQMTSGKAALNLLTTFMNSFNPIQGSDLVDTITPTIVKPVAEHYRNSNFMGAPIYPEYPFDQYDRPESRKYWKGTDPLLVEVMEGMNNITGGGDTVSGVVDISPEIVKHYFDWVFGGMGQFVTRGISVGTSLGFGQEVEQKDWPLLRQFGGKVGSGYDRNRFYDAVRQVEAVKAQIRIHEERGEKEERNAYKANNKPLVKLGYRTTNYRNKISRLQTKIDAAVKDRDRDLAQELRDEQRLVMQEFTRKFDEAMDQIE